MELGPRLRTDTALRLILGKLREAVGGTVDAVVEGQDPEALHDLRVAVRRARSLLGQVRGVFPGGRARLLRRELRWVGTLTGPCRDLDILVQDIEACAEEATAGQAPAFADLLEIATHRRREAHEHLVIGLASPRFGALLREWSSLADPDTPLGKAGPRADRPIVETARRSILRARSRLVEHGRARDVPPTDARLHRVRIDAKKLRYLLELFGPLYERRELRSRLKTLKELQDVLGRHHDAAVQAAWLEELAASGAAPTGTLPAVTAMETLLDRRREELRRRFVPLFERVASPREETLLQRLLGAAEHR